MCCQPFNRSELPVVHGQLHKRHPVGKGRIEIGGCKPVTYFIQCGRIAPAGCFCQGNLYLEADDAGVLPYTISESKRRAS